MKLRQTLKLRFDTYSLDFFLAKEQGIPFHFEHNQTCPTKLKNSNILRLVMNKILQCKRILSPVYINHSHRTRSTTSKSIKTSHKNYNIRYEIHQIIFYPLFQRVYKFFRSSLFLSEYITQNILAHIHVYNILASLHAYAYHSYHFYQTMVIRISDSIAIKLI